MIGKGGFAPFFSAIPLRKQRIAAAWVLLFALASQSLDLRAELLFRSVEQVNGEQRWSGDRKYSNPSDTAYPRVSAGGARLPSEDVRVFLSGPITSADVASAEVMVTLIQSGKQKIVNNSVWLASTGGDMDASMELGRLLRKAGLFTYIGKNDRCFSACVFAFMGGERRTVAGQLGIHRPYFPLTQDFPGRQAKYRRLQRILKDYIEELDFPTSLYEAVMLVPPESMKILAPSELKMFYLEGISPSSEDLEDAAAARSLGLSMFEYLRRKARMPACATPVADPARCEDSSPQAATRGGAADDPEAPKKSTEASTGRAVAHGSRDAQDSAARSSGIRIPD